MSIADLVTCVGIALGATELNDCMPCDNDAKGDVTVDELIQSVNVALGTSPDNVTLRGQCRAPCGNEGECAQATANGLVPCENQDVNVSQCGDDGDCSAAITQGANLAQGIVLCWRGDVALLIQEPDTGYRVLDFGTVGGVTSASTLGQSQGLRDILISPTSEAAVRLLQDNGLARFDSQGVREVTDAVEDATSGLDFRGLTPEDAAGAATDTARANDQVQEVVARTPMLQIGDVTGAPGQVVSFTVSLSTKGRAVANIQNDVGFQSAAPIAARADGRPDCTVDPSIDKSASTFAFIPPQCAASVGCTGVRALILSFDNVTPIPDGSTLYSCNVQTAAGASGAYPLDCPSALASSPAADEIAPECVAGHVIVTGPGFSMSLLRNHP